MAVRPTVDGLVRCAVSGTYEGEPWVNVFHFWDSTASGPTTLIDLNLLYTKLNTSGAGGSTRTFWTGIYSLFDDGLAVSQAVLETYDGESSLQIVKNPTAVGASGGTNIAPFNAVLVKWSDGTISRHGKGRTYLSGLNSGMVQSGNSDQVDPTFKTSVTTRMGEVRAGVASVCAPFVMCVFSRELAQARPIDTVSVDETVAIQKRRRTSTR